MASFYHFHRFSKENRPDKEAQILFKLVAELHVDVSLFELDIMQGF